MSVSFSTSWEVEQEQANQTPEATTLNSYCSTLNHVISLCEDGLMKLFAKSKYNTFFLQSI